MENEIKIEDAKMTKLEYETSIVKNLPPLTRAEIEISREDLERFIEEHRSTKNFFLLSNELRYYTIFRRDSAITTSKGSSANVMAFLIGDAFLKGLGKLKVFKRTDRDEIEIWIGETYFLFFDADSFFVLM